MSVSCFTLSQDTVSVFVIEWNLPLITPFSCVTHWKVRKPFNISTTLPGQHRSDWIYKQVYCGWNMRNAYVVFYYTIMPKAAVWPTYSQQIKEKACKNTFANRPINFSLSTQNRATATKQTWPSFSWMRSLSPSFLTFAGESSAK